MARNADQVVLEEVTPVPPLQPGDTELLRTYAFGFPSGGVDSAGESDVKVSVDNVPVLPSQYRVRLDPDGQSGTIELLDAPAITNPVPLIAGDIVRIYRDTTVEHSTAFAAKGVAGAATVRTFAGRMVRTMQELADRQERQAEGSIDTEDIKDFALEGAQGRPIRSDDLTLAVKEYARAQGRLIGAGDIAEGVIGGAGDTGGHIAEGSVGYDELEDGVTDAIRGSADASGVSFDTGTRNLSIPDNAGGSPKVVNIPGGSQPDASESVKGIVRLATPTQTRSTTPSDSLAVTPEGLQGLTASDTRRGLIEIANQTEGRSGSSGTGGLKAMTPERTADYVDRQFPADRRLPDPQSGDTGKPLVAKGAGVAPAYEAVAASQVAIDASGFTGDGNLNTGTNTVQKLAQEVETLTTGGGGGTSIDKASAADVTTGTDDAKYMTVLRTLQAIHEHQVPVRATLPAQPWRIGTRIILTADATVRGDPVIHYTERDSSPISNEFALPGQTNATGPRFIRSYSDAWGSSSSNPLRNRVIIDAAQLTAPHSGAQFVWYPANRAYNASTDLYAIEDAHIPGYTRFFRVGQNQAGHTLGFADTDLGARYGGYRVNIVNWTAGAGDFWPTATVESGDITYAGRGEGVGGWIETPVRGLDREEVIALIRQLASTEAITEIANGPGTGVNLISDQTRYQETVFDPPGDDLSFFDLSADDHQSGLVELEATLTMGTPSGSSNLRNTLGFGTPGQRTIRFSGFAFASTLRGLTPSSASATVAGTNGILVGQTDLVVSRNAQAATVGTLRLYQGRQAQSRLDYWWHYTPASSAISGIQVGIAVNLVGGFIHQESSGGGGEEADLELNTRGAMPVATTIALPTGSVASGSRIFAAAGSWWTGSNRPNEGQWRPVFGNRKIQGPAVPPNSQVLGIWVVSKVAGTEYHSVFMPWGPGALEEETIGNDRAQAILWFSGLGGGTPDNKCLVQYHVTDTGFIEVELLGQGTGFPANSTVEIYNAGLFGTGARGPKGDKGDAGEGTTIPRYATLDLLPAPASLEAGARAEVIEETAPYSVMDFAVTGHAAGSRVWKCIGGSSADLVGSAGIRVPSAQTGVLVADRWYQIVTGSSPTTYAEWDMRFPFFQINFGGAGGPTNGPWWYAAQWYTLDAEAVNGLTAGTVGQDSSTSGTFLEVSIWQQNVAIGGDDQARFRVIRLGRTSANRILIAARSAIGSVSPNPPHIVPFRVRGHA